MPGEPAVTGATTVVPDALRIQLEGRLEVLERANVRYAALLRQLSLPAWRRRVRRSPEWLRAAREQEAAVTEALECLERRAARAESSGDPRVRALCHSLQTQRARLEARTRKRLQVLTSRTGESLPALLASLEDVLLAPAASPLAKNEEVLLEGHQTFPHFLMVLLEMALYPLMALIIALLWGEMGQVIGRRMMFAWMLVPLVTHVALPALLPLGRFRLTEERLVWNAWWREPVEVKLASIPPEGISYIPDEHAVYVNGERWLSMSKLDCAWQLAALLYHLRQRGALPRDAEPQVHPVVISTARRVQRGENGDSSSPGVLVLRPGYAAFLPGDMRLGALLTRLRQLPSEEFDEFVVSATVERRGQTWKPGELRGEPMPLIGEWTYRLIEAGPAQQVEFLMQAAQRPLCERIFAIWDMKANEQ